MKRRLGKNVYLKKDEYGDCDEDFQVNEIDIYPITLKQQEDLRKLFELLEINASIKLFGYTKIIIKTREMDADVLAKIFGDYKNDKKK